MKSKLQQLTNSIRDCKICSQHFTHQPNPIVQLGTKALILIAGQAPGRKAHKSSIPFDDPSGDRLRIWMGVTKDVFYDPNKIAILPIGFCFPGQKKGSDLRPRRECAETWRDEVMDLLPNIKFILVIGQYAIEWHLKESKKPNLTETVKCWKEYGPSLMPLPHPSPRNNIWLRKNSWFENDVVPKLQTRIRRCLSAK